ncbi:endonuclease/exonuclease/phosphatase family protein [Paenibacillus sp. IITD108]|uniref:endonuclease/exonuclease/phosphatase family protein n=1 Tax=Paenibacillus sp. IITD108 TaxID=3116649 RepID=UPI002F3E3A7B
MKIIQYNVLDGCQEPGRLSLLKNWIANQQADIVGFNELNDWTKESLADFAEQTYFSYSYLFEDQPSKYRIGLMSKTPIEYKGCLTEHFWHGVIHVKTAGINIMITHLSPAESVSREKEAALIAAHMVNMQNEPALLMGDMNTLSAHDSRYYTEANMLQLLNGNEKLSLKFCHHGTINYKPMQILLDSGLTDVGTSHGFQHSVPTQMNEDAMHAAKLRLDYVLINKALLQRNPAASICYDQETDLISDHYPIVCTWSS